MRERNPLASLAGFGHAPIPRPENTSNDKRAVATVRALMLRKALVLRKWNANRVARLRARGTVKNEDGRNSADEEMQARRRGAPVVAHHGLAEFADVAGTLIFALQHAELERHCDRT
jgi:hypothetical protein